MAIDAILECQRLRAASEAAGSSSGAASSGYVQYPNWGQSWGWRQHQQVTWSDWQWAEAWSRPAPFVCLPVAPIAVPLALVPTNPDQQEPHNPPTNDGDKEPVGTVADPNPQSSDKEEPIPKTTIQVYTFGLRSLPVNLHKQHHNQESIRKLFCQAHPNIEPKLLNCLALKNFHPKAKRKHIGEHATIMEEVRANPRFQELLNEAYTMVKAAKEGAGHINLCLYCHRGRVRSVAVARLIVECLRAVGENPEEPIHLSASGWGDRVCRGGCDSCRSGRNVDPDKRTTIQSAIRSWKRLCMAYDM